MVSPTEFESTSIAEIMAQYPQTKAVFQTFGLYLYGQSPTASYENLKASCLVQGVDLNQITLALQEAIQA
jgi:hypothetical protein